MSDVLGAELAVARAETALADAEEALREATLLAPFDGVVEAIEIEAGDGVSAAAVAFVLTDLDRIVVELTVTEGDLLDLEPGQVGLATFNAIDGVDYPVRVTSVSSLPVVDQGVVTYAVEAEVLPVSELAAVAEGLSALRDGATGGFAGFAGGAGGGAAADAGGGGGGRAGGAAGFLDQLLAGVKLPEGVTAQEVLLAVAGGETLPEGVTLPEGFELPEQLRQRLASGGLPGAAGTADRAGAAERGGAGGAERGGAGTGAAADVEAPERLLPAPGMTASVTLLAEVRAEAVLGPGRGRAPARRRADRDGPGGGRRDRARHRQRRLQRRHLGRDPRGGAGGRHAPHRRRDGGRPLQCDAADAGRCPGRIRGLRRPGRRRRCWGRRRRPVIRLEQLTRSYATGAGDVHALAGVDLEIRRGEFVAIMGQSGSGKTTLMSIIGCLDRPTGGRYLIDDHDIGRLDDDGRARLRGAAFGFVFQSYNLLPRLSALEQVELPLIYQGVKDRGRRAAEALVRVGLADCVTHRSHELSGGQQRVAIARALVVDPLLLLADEPTGALDAQTGVEVMELLAELVAERGLTVVLVTHESEVADFAARVIRMRDGRVVENVRRKLPRESSAASAPPGPAPTPLRGIAR